MREHVNEPVPGLPERLPEGETILWQGAPRWWRLTVHAFHLRMLGIYFVMLAAWHVAASVADGTGAVQGVVGTLVLVPIAIAAVGLLALFGRLLGRSTLYTITNRRVVLRIGVALPMTVNIPFATIRSADLRRHADGTGDLVLGLSAAHRVSWLALWPHARPWHVARPEPMLRALADPDAAAQVLARALAASAGMVVVPLPESAPASRPDAEAVARA